MVSTSWAWVQKQSWTDAKVIPLGQRKREVSIMWELSSEWMKLGGNPFRFLIELTLTFSGVLLRDLTPKLISRLCFQFFLLMTLL